MLVAGVGACDGEAVQVAGDGAVGVVVPELRIGVMVEGKGAIGVVP